MAPSIYTHSHSPAQHFGRVAYDFLASQITDWDGCPDDDAPAAEHAADLDRRVLRLLLADAPAYKKRKQSDDSPREEIITLAGERIGWHRALPELKCWAGQMSLRSIVGARVAATVEAGEPGAPLLDWQVPLKTCSGIDARCAPHALDDGFSVAMLGMAIYTYTACELLAVLGMGISPIVRYGYRNYGYVDPLGQWWQFHVAERQGYHRCYTMSQRVDENVLRRGSIMDDRR